MHTTTSDTAFRKTSALHAPRSESDIRAKPKPAATTVPQIRDALFDESIWVSDTQLLILILGTGTTRHTKGLEKKTWTAIDLASDLLSEPGGRLEHLVSATRRSDFDRPHFGLGKTLGSRLFATMELAYRWRRGFKAGGSLSVRWGEDIDLPQKVLEHDPSLTEGELMAVLLNRYWPTHREIAPHLAANSGAEVLVRSLTPQAFSCKAEPWRWLSNFDRNGVCRLLAALEVARRHRRRASFERSDEIAKTFALSSSYLSKLLDPESPIDRPQRQRLLENVRSNPRMAADFAKLDLLAFDAKTAEYGQAIRCHLMFEALVDQENWSNPAELLGEPVPYRALLSIAEARIARAESGPRSAKVKELLEAAELAVAREPLTLFAKTLVDLGVSEEGLEKVLEQVRRLHSGTPQHHHLPLAPPPEENPPPDEPPENPPPPEEPP